MRNKKNLSVLRKEAREKKRKRKFQKVWVLALALMCVCVIIGGVWYFGRDKTSYAGADEWEDWDLAKMEAVDDKTKGTDVEQTLTTARATFYDIYSDTQVYGNGGYLSEAGAITDGHSSGTWAVGNNTFTRFNNYLKHSLINNTSEEYWQLYDHGIYPLYCGLMYVGQSKNNRWGDWVTATDVNDGWWHAYANCNQYDNGKNMMADEGVATNIGGGAAQGLVNDKLDSNGNITMGKGEYEMVVPFFDSEFLSTPYEQGKVTLGSSVSNIAFPFHKGKDGQVVYMYSDRPGSVFWDNESPDYYYFDSYCDIIKLDEVNKRVSYNYGRRHDTYPGDNGKFVYDTDGKRGFFPYNNAGDSNENLNYVFGVKMELNFNMTSDGKIKGENIIFEFNGDDDLWVFVDGYLVLDIGGAHIPVHGKIDFATKEATVDSVKKSGAKDKQNVDLGSGDFESKAYDFGSTATDENGKKLYQLLSDTTRNHTLTVFYMERGKSNSNLKIKFNLPQITTLSVGDEVDASNVNEELKTDALWKACNNHYFRYSLENKGTEEKDYNNAVTVEKNPIARTTFEPIGLTETYRKKLTSEDGATQRLRFYTFTGKNYYSMVVGGTHVNLPTLALDDGNIIDSNGCAVIDGVEYIFKGWTTDESYRDNWEKIKNNEYVGGMPKLVSTDTVTVTQDIDYYAVWVKKTITVYYYDEANVDKPLGYASGNSDFVQIGQQTIVINRGWTGIAASNFWTDSDLNDGIAQSNGNGGTWRNEWKTDATRKGFHLNGWRLIPMEEEGEHLLIKDEFPGGFIPLCDVKLYADWSRTCYRAQFQVNEDVEQIKDSNDKNENTTDQTWSSNIVYFPIGYSGYLPYINEDSKTNSFLENIDGDYETVVCYDFSTIPIRENYAISLWTDEEGNSYRTFRYEGSNGNMLYPQEWKLGRQDVVFTGTWRKIISAITYDAGTEHTGSQDWGERKLKYTVGTSISKPEISTIWGDVAAETGWKIIGWQDSDGKQITFPYKITDKNGKWTAIWKKVSSSVLYKFADKSKGIEGTTSTGETSYKKYYDVGAVIELPTLESMRSSAPKDDTGTVNGVTNYVKGKDGKAYIITGWKDEEGNEVQKGAVVTEDNITLTAIWEEVATTLNVTVEVPKEDKNEWDSEKAVKNGWTNKGTKWTLSLKLTPGTKVASYFEKETDVYQKLYGADVPIENDDMKHFKELSYHTIVYTAGNNIQLDDENVVVPYTAHDHTLTLTGTWMQKKILTTFMSVVPNNEEADNNESTENEPQVIGCLIYSVSEEEASLPDSEAEFLLYDNKTKMPVIDGYKLIGWKRNNEGEPVTTFVPATDAHQSIWYAVWEKEETLAAEENNISATDNSNVENSRSVSLPARILRALSFSSLGGYTAFAGELYELNDLLTVDTGATGMTKNEGDFYLTYDQAASFLNCFTVGSTMHLQEKDAIYNNGGTVQTYDSAAYRNMYKTTWELRDLHGYIINRNDNTDLKNMSMSESGSTSVYDGRVNGEQNKAFAFKNENEATGAGYATNVRALFTHTIQTGDITISKKLTATASSVAKRKGETEQEFIFKVYFYNMFGDTTDDISKKTLYTGSYKKLNKYGNYVRDENDKILTYTAHKGKILVKSGETAVITGIPVLTKYVIEEEDAETKTGKYMLSEAKEITAKGSVVQNKKYAVSDETSKEVQEYLEKYNTSNDESVYSSKLVDNSGILSGKKLNDLTDEQVIEHSFEGQILKSNYTYNYVAANEILVNGVSLYLDKIIDEFYYGENDRFTDYLEYDELVNHAKQTFVFNIKYIPVDNMGNAKIAETENYNERLTFDPTDNTIEKVDLPKAFQTEESKKGYKRSGIVIGLEPGYYEISEDENWSWKYDLMGIYEAAYRSGEDASEETTIYQEKDREKSIQDKEEGKKVFRFYIRGQQEETINDMQQDASGSYKKYNNNGYRILENVEDPTVTFVNLKAIDERSKTSGDTDIAVNKITVPTPTPNPNEYEDIRFDGEGETDFPTKYTLLAGEIRSLPRVKAAPIDGSSSAITLEYKDVEWKVTGGDPGVVEIQGDKATLKAVREGTVYLKATYRDKDGITIHETMREIEYTVKNPQIFSLYNSSASQNISNYSAQCEVYASSQQSNLGHGANNVINGNPFSDTSFWCTDNGSWSGSDGNVYWALMFRKDNNDFKRKISSIELVRPSSNSEVTIQVYGIIGTTDEFTSNRANLIPLGDVQTFSSGVTSIRIDIDSNQYAEYNGIKVKMISMSNGTDWPVLQGVQITGLYE